MSYIADGGRKYVLFFSILLIFSILFGFCEYFFIFALFFCIYIFRNLKPSISIVDPLAIYAPIDGKVLHVKSICIEGNRFVKIVIQKRLFDSGVLRAICDCEIIDFTKTNGLFLCNYIKSSKSLNSQALYLFKVHDFTYEMKVIYGALSRSVCLKNRQFLKVCDDLGFIGSGEVEILLPDKTKICVGVGEKVKAGCVLGYFERR